MFARIIDWSIGNRLLVILGTLFIAVAGVFSLTRTPIDAIPDLSDVQVIIRTEYPGQAPRIVEDQVTYPLTHADAVGAVRAGGARLFVLRRLLRPRHLRGRGPTSTGPAAGSSNT